MRAASSAFGMTSVGSSSKVFDQSVVVRHPVVGQRVGGIESDGLPEIIHALVQAFLRELTRKVTAFQIELIGFGIRGLALRHVRHLGVAEAQPQLLHDLMRDVVLHRQRVRQLAIVLLAPQVAVVARRPPTPR